MTRSAAETARILKKLYRREFGGDFSEPYRLTWDNLRIMAGVDQLKADYLTEVNESLLADDFALLTFNNLFLVAGEGDFSAIRSLPARLVEKYHATASEDDEDLEFSEEED